MGFLMPDYRLDDYQDMSFAEIFLQGVPIADIAHMYFTTPREVEDKIRRQLRDTIEELTTSELAPWEFSGEWD